MGTVIEAECNIDFSSCVGIRPTKRQFGSVDIAMDFSQGAGGTEPVKVIFKGKHAEEVFQLGMLANKGEADQAAYAKEGFPDDVDGLTDKECADWVRGKILARLIELAGDNDESVPNTATEG